MVAQILSPAQRAALFDPPSDRATIERLSDLAPWPTLRPLVAGPMNGRAIE